MNKSAKLINFAEINWGDGRSVILIIKTRVNFILAEIGISREYLVPDASHNLPKTEVFRSHETARKKFDMLKELAKESMKECEGEEIVVIGDNTKEENTAQNTEHAQKGT